jgi:hypothetical protein
MFSNLASYIFGTSDEAANEVEASPGQRPNVKDGPGEDEWVVVGGDVQPSLTLGSLNDMAPRPSTGSTGSSETPSEISGEDDIVIVEPADDHETNGPREVTLTRSGRHLTSPLACPNGITLPQMKAFRSSQKVKQKDTTKHLTGKSSERHNKAVKIRSNHHNKRNKSATLAIRASGCNKSLKQC